MSSILPEFGTKPSATVAKCEPIAVKDRAHDERRGRLDDRLAAVPLTINERVPSTLSDRSADKRRGHAEALLIGEDPFLFERGKQLVALAARHAVPAIYLERQFAAVGGLLSYGPSLAATYRQVGLYAGKVLRGVKPADLPVV